MGQYVRMGWGEVGRVLIAPSCSCAYSWQLLFLARFGGTTNMKAVMSSQEGSALLMTAAMSSQVGLTPFMAAAMFNRLRFRSSHGYF